MKQTYIIALVAAMFAAAACIGGGQHQTVSPENYQSANPENMQQVRDFLHQAGCYFLATVDGDQPRVRPFGTVDIFEGRLYIQTGKVKDVSKQLQKNPKAEICAFANGTWVRVAGELIRDVEALQRTPAGSRSAENECTG